MSEKQSVQNFQWDGSAPRIEGNYIWFRSIDGSEHGWPQLTDTEAMRLVLFLNGSQKRAASVRVVRMFAKTPEDVYGPLQLGPNQCIAISGRRAEAAAGGGGRS